MKTLPKKRAVTLVSNVTPDERSDKTKALDYARVMMNHAHRALRELATAKEHGDREEFGGVYLELVYTHEFIAKAIESLGDLIKDETLDEATHQ